VAATPMALLRSTTRVPRRRVPQAVPQADGVTPTEIPQAAPGPCRPVVDARLGPRAGAERAARDERRRTSAFPGGIRSSMTCSRSCSDTARPSQLSP
jgi:hypothetical protein